MEIGTLPAGTRGFDANTRITVAQARAFVDAGYKFVVRYVRRSTKHDYDITTGEFVGLLNAGLGVMIVQHVAAEGWAPTRELGAAYGAIAAQEAAAVGYPRSCIVWCDLEGISPIARAADVIAFCNSWYDKVREAGFDAGLYVGYGAGLTADQLYYKLKFRRYWSAYNLNSDSLPSVRGVCMKQGAYPPPSQRVKGIPFEYDTDLITGDHFNNFPTLILPGDPG